jgi:hypothetical protein
MVEGWEDIPKPENLSERWDDIFKVEDVDERREVSILELNDTFEPGEFEFGTKWCFAILGGSTPFGEFGLP